MSDILTPYFRLYISGKEIDEERYSMIEEIVFEDTSSGSDLLTIKITDPDFVFINDDIFIPDVKVKLVGGFTHNNRTMFEGYISLIFMDFPNIGSPTLEINCLDNTHIMNRSKKKRTWENKRRSDVAREILQSYGFNVVIDSSPTIEENISQSNTTDIEFLETLAGEEIATYYTYVEQGTGYYVKKKLLNSPQATLDYRDGNQQIISFSPSINKEVKQIEVEKSEVDAVTKKIERAKANDANTNRATQGTSPTPSAVRI